MRLDHHDKQEIKSLVVDTIKDKYKLILETVIDQAEKKIKEQVNQALYSTEAQGLINKSVKRHLAECTHLPGDHSGADRSSLCRLRMEEFSDPAQDKTGTLWSEGEDMDLIQSFKGFLHQRAFFGHERTRQALQWRIYKHLAWALQKKEV